MEDIFDSVSRTAGDFAGVFEFDGETAYFYLYNLNADDNAKVVNKIRVFVGMPDFLDTEASIKWDAEERKVGLFIRGDLWAGFDCDTGAQFGGNYRPRAIPEISPDVARAFAVLSPPDRDG
jgi:hypothetical protein